MHKRIRILLPLLMVLLMLPVQALAELTGLPLSMTSAVLDKGEKLDIRGDYSGDIDWSTSDRSIATISRGVISGRKAGSCTVTATLEDGSAYDCAVTVMQPVTRVSLPSRITLANGETHALLPEIRPSDATDKTLIYTSSDETVAEVNQNGVVTARKAGKATITAAARSGKKDTVRITVTQPVTSLSLNTAFATLDKGKKLTLTANFLPLDATDTDIEWRSSDKKIATVSRGVVTARKAGVCVITATSESGVVASCTLTVTQPVTRVELPSRATVANGQTYALAPKVSPSDATDKTIVYTSSDETVAVVDENGVVTALRAGKAEITATAKSGEDDTIRITVTQPVTSLSLNTASAVLDKGRRLTLTANFLPLDATDTDIEWTTSDRKVATVSRGVVTARRAGVCVITATSESGVVASCTLTVTQPVTRVELPSRATVANGQTYALAPKVSPSDATDKTISYSSSDETVAVVDENGVVTALRAGKAEITATAKSGEDDTVRITVTQPVTALSLNAASAALDKGKKLTLTANFLPLDATDTDIRWSSSDKKVATVSSRGEISAKKAGSCVITATSESGITVTCAVTVTQPVTSVSLPSSKTVSRNTTYALTPAVKPENATDRTLTFHSSNPSIASVDENGVVTAHADGRAVITATAKSGKKDTIRITVETTHVESLSLSGYYLTLNPGETGALRPIVEPEDASDPGVRFASSDPSIVTVDGTGMLTAVKPGSATVTVTSLENAAITAACQVFVRDPNGKGRLDGVIIGINPGHQIKGNFTQAPLAPGSSETGNKIGVGCTGVKTKNREYEINLQIGLMLRDRLEAEGATVIMTRTSNDVNITNIERAQLLNRANVDLAIQLHCNASATGDKNRNGIELYAKHADQPALNAAALMLEEMIRETGAVNRGVKKSSHYMSLNWSETPAILVEMGYMSNPKEDVLLGTPSYQAKLVEGMYEGIARAFGR